MYGNCKFFASDCQVIMIGALEEIIKKNTYNCGEKQAVEVLPR